MVSAVSFRSFRFDVSPFSACHFITHCIFCETLHFIYIYNSLHFLRAACDLKYKMDYTRITETNITMCNQLYFAPNYLKYSDLTKSECLSVKMS